MPQRRAWHTYHFKIGNKIIHKGITKDLDRREGEHQALNPEGHIFEVGGAKTEKGARDWEKEQGVS